MILLIVNIFFFYFLICDFHTINFQLAYLACNANDLFVFNCEIKVLPTEPNKKWMCMDISNTMIRVYIMLYAELTKVLEHHGWHHLHWARVLVLIVRLKNWELFQSSDVSRKPLVMWLISTLPRSKSQTVFTRHPSNDGTRVFTKIIRRKLKKLLMREYIENSNVRWTVYAKYSGGEENNLAIWNNSREVFKSKQR